MKTLSKTVKYFWVQHAGELLAAKKVMYQLEHFKKEFEVHEWYLIGEEHNKMINESEIEILQEIQMP